MAREIHPKTLFHLVPTNEIAHDVLLHPDNKRFVSSSKYGFGLEIGYHVASLPRGHVITRLGRNADLILRKSTPEHAMSAIHVAFQINPATHLVLLSVRSKRISSVRFSVLHDSEVKNVTGEESNSEDTTGEEVVGEEITGDGVILYGQNYKISIASYRFNLVWRTIFPDPTANIESLKALTVQGYRTSLQRLQDVRSRDRPTENDNSEAQSWHITRLNTTKAPVFKDIEHLRIKIGSGAYGTVFEAVDQSSGYKFAIKVVTLDFHSDIEAARALLHREIKVMERVRHEHIIEYLGHQLFHTLRPEIFMPLRHGSLTSLAKSPPPSLNHDQLCLIVLEQMLSALDYLASEKLIHRDIKPDNILYSLSSKDHYHFQLADFGLAHHRSLATTFCGTGYYQAPELWPGISRVNARQSPKIDIWSLFASIVAVNSGFKNFPPDTSDYGIVLDNLKAKAAVSPLLEPMARLHPDYRASAAQMVVILFEGRGLTTPRSKIPPLEPDAKKTTQASPSPVAQPSDCPQARSNRGKASKRPTAAASPLVVYHPRRRVVPLRAPGDPSARLPPTILKRADNPSQPTKSQLQPIRAHRDGVVKQRATPSAVRTDVFARPPPKQKPLAETLSGIITQIPGSFID